MIKGSIEKDHIFVNIRASKYVKKILTAMEEEIDNHTMIVGEFNNSLHQWTDHPGSALWPPFYRGGTEVWIGYWSYPGWNSLYFE